MERFVKGDVIVVPFPFSDLTNSKKRPALVVADLTGDDFILCQITSRSRIDDYSIDLDIVDFKKGGLKLRSMIRPNRLFTADKSIALYKIGSLNNRKSKMVEEAVVEIFKK